MRSLIISLVTMMALAAQGMLPASANAIWVDYQVVVNPAKQGAVVSAFNKYKTTQTGRAFPGDVLERASCKRSKPVHAQPSCCL